jgi:hypothetical protein
VAELDGHDHSSLSLAGNLMNEMLAESLGDQIIAQAVGPLVTVLLGGFALGFITRQFQMRDADQKLRESMALDVARVGGLFYSLVAAAMRANDSRDQQLINITKKQLEDNFPKFIVDGGVLEKRLAAYSRQCYLDWHAASDCATVLFYGIAGFAEVTVNRIVTINAKGYDGKEHSRLSEEDLRNNRHAVMDQFASQMSNINSETLRKSKNTTGRKTWVRGKTGEGAG